MKRSAIRIGGWLAAPLCLTALACAQSVSQPTATAVVSPAAHAERVALLKTLLAGCVAQPSQCKPDGVGPDEYVQLDAGPVTRIRLEWLRDGIRHLGEETGAPRNSLAETLSARLESLQKAGNADFSFSAGQARGPFDRVLAAREFAPEPEPNWLVRKWRQFLRWLDKMLYKGFLTVSKTPPWMRFFIECLFFLVPAVLLVLWLLRQVREDRLHPAGKSDPGQGAITDPQTDWLALAARFARERDWRQAIHALYWATIAGFESRKTWARNRTRTPREYLRLLEPGSPARAALMEQTNLFEATWYGYRAATEADCERAVRLRAASEAR